MISCSYIRTSGRMESRRRKMSADMSPDRVAHKRNELNDTITINMSGTKFEVMRKTINRFPQSKLGSIETMEAHYRPSKDEYYFDRSPFLFDLVLNFYRSGEMHLPTNVCSLAIKRELEYWEISDKLMEDCCWVPYNSNMMRISSLNKFKRSYASTADLSDEEKCCGTTGWAKYQPKIWAFLDDHNSSIGAKIFAVISVLLVLLTTFTFVAETLPSFKQNMTATDYADLHETSVQEVVNSIERQKSTQISPINETGETKFSALNPSTRKKRSVGVFNYMRSFVLKDDDDDEEDTDDYKDDGDDYESVAFQREFIRRRRDVLNQSDIDNTEPPHLSELELELDSLLVAPNHAFEIIDIIAYAFFTIELLLRIIFCPDKCAFFKNGLNIIDILALIPYYIEILVHILYRREKYQESFLDALYVLRIVRIFRIFRMVRHYKGLQVLVYTLRASAREMMLMMIFLSLGMLIFASLIYYTKGPDDDFTSIPHAFWWAVVTMTTVGYGDMVPKTGAGYLIGSGCALSGVLVISFTVPVIVNNFMLFYQHVEYNKRKRDVQQAKKLWLNKSQSVRTKHVNGQGPPPTIKLSSPPEKHRKKKKKRGQEKESYPGATLSPDPDNEGITITVL